MKSTNSKTELSQSAKSAEKSTVETELDVRSRHDFNDIEDVTNIENDLVQTGYRKQARYDEVSVYNELADQSVTKIHLLQQINKQMSELETMIKRRQFILKEVSGIIIKDEF